MFWLISNLYSPHSQDTKSISSEKIKIKPVQEVEGHPLGPASLLLSPDCIWLASVGQDGLLYVRQTASMVNSISVSISCSVVVCFILLLRLQENITKLQCHSCNAGGIQRVSFSTDGLALLTTGFRDDCLVCTELR